MIGPHFDRVVVPNWPTYILAMAEMAKMRTPHIANTNIAVVQLACKMLENGVFMAQSHQKNDRAPWKPPF
jgi:hypothetical protein